MYSILKESSNSESSESQGKELSDDECIMDTLLMLFGGFDTTSHLVVSLLYQLKANPSKLDKLMEELNKYEITQINELSSDKKKDAFQNCDYLYYCIKEALRIDNPAEASLFYKTLDDISICNVPISKGETVSVNLVYPHYNCDNYYNAFEYIPERFDPSSKYFMRPSNPSLPRDPKSFIPFSLGPRNCAGQVLAKLESKVILSRILTRIEFEIDPEIMKYEHKRFNLIEKEELKATVLKIK